MQHIDDVNLGNVGGIIFNHFRSSGTRDNVVKMGRCLLEIAVCINRLGEKKSEMLTRLPLRDKLNSWLFMQNLVYS